MPTIQSGNRLLALWRSYKRDEKAPEGAAPWWRLFDLCLKLRVWGPDDRLPSGIRAAFEDRIKDKSDADHINIELEIFPSVNPADRESWRQETEAKLSELQGKVVDRSSISGDGFIYEAILASLPVHAVRSLIEAPHHPTSIAWIKGLQFILPQAIAQAPVDPAEETQRASQTFLPFDILAPYRAVLLDGMPAAAHPAIVDGAAVEDVNELAILSMVDHRKHATAMASLILRGDLKADKVPLGLSRLLCVPIMIDTFKGGVSQEKKLFIDVIHTTLARLFTGEEPLAPDAFAVNLSIGLPERRFSGQISSLARLLDWWSHEHGILFVVSAGNIPDEIVLPDMDHAAFLESDPAGRKKAISAAIENQAYARSLMPPAEALNVLTVGAISQDLASHANHGSDGHIRIDYEGKFFPAISSALGLGPFRCIKPDLCHTGGVQEVRAGTPGMPVKLSPVRFNVNNGLVVASSRHEEYRTARGTSCAAALTTRAILQSAAALTAEDGPYHDIDLSRRDLALLTRALAVNASDWPDEALSLYNDTIARLGSRKSARAKENVAKHFGYGYLFPERMRQSPSNGVTFVSIDDVRKDEGKIFDLPLPPSLSGDAVPRSMRITLAWFSPISSSRARYRLASLKAISADQNEDFDGEGDEGWGLLLKSNGPDSRMIAKGTTWSRRLVHKRLASPAYLSDKSVPIRVQCQDAKWRRT